MKEIRCFTDRELYYLAPKSGLYQPSGRVSALSVGDHLHDGPVVDYAPL